MKTFWKGKATESLGKIVHYILLFCTEFPNEELNKSVCLFVSSTHKIMFVCCFEEALHFFKLTGALIVMFVICCCHFLKKVLITYKSTLFLFSFFYTHQWDQEIDHMQLIIHWTNLCRMNVNLCCFCGVNFPVHVIVQSKSFSLTFETVLFITVFEFCTVFIGSTCSV